MKKEKLVRIAPSSLKRGRAWMITEGRLTGAQKVK